jgi:hypothetical protein
MNEIKEDAKMKRTITLTVALGKTSRMNGDKWDAIVVRDGNTNPTRPNGTDWFRTLSSVKEVSVVIETEKAKGAEGHYVGREYDYIASNFVSADVEDDLSIMAVKQWIFDNQRALNENVDIDQI